MAAAKIAYLLLLLMFHVGNVHSYGPLGALKDIMEPILKSGNVALGSFSRSKSITTMSRQNRKDGIEEIQEDLAMTIATLAVLDIGGGALVPFIDNLVEQIYTSRDFDRTRRVFSFKEGETATNFDELFKNSNNLNGDDLKEAANNAFKTRRRESLSALDTDVDKAMKGGNRRLINGFSKVKGMFKVRNVVKVLGPLFDVINIGMSSRVLHTTRQACQQEPATCNQGALASASLCIVSGILGIAAFATSAFPPLSGVIGIVSILLGITATLIDLIYAPPVDRGKIQFDKLAKVMFKMDAYSRMQLEANSLYLKSSGLDNTDLYVINQGHFPDWMGKLIEENGYTNMEGLTGDIRFGYGEKDAYKSDGRMKDRIELKGICNDIPQRGPTELEPPEEETDDVCVYNQEGATDEEMTVPKGGKNYKFGPSFYGITENWLSGHQGKKKDIDEQSRTNGREYKGAMIFVNTNEVTNYALTEALRKVRGYAVEIQNTTVRLRGLDIDTEKRFVDHFPEVDRQNFNDVVGLGDLRNLKDDGWRGVSRIKIRTGLGRDALNIDGWVRYLDADLGVNHNTLSFHGMSESPQKQRGDGARYWDDKCREKETMFYDTQIQGVKFNPKDGKVEFVIARFDTCTERYTYTEEIVLAGKVKGVGILSGSPFDYDEYTLYALQKDPTNPDDHYTIFKLNKGKAKYVFDANSFKSRAFNGEAPHFKIIDGTKSNDCAWKPKLSIKNLAVGSKIKDIYLVNNKISIYQVEGGQRAVVATILFSTSCPGEVEAANTRGNNIFTGEVAELDMMEYDGDRFEHHFNRDRNSDISEDNIAYLHCPERRVTTQRTIESVRTIVVNGKFMKDCDIDDSSKVIVEVSKRGPRKSLTLSFTGVTKFGATQRMVRVDRIVNEYGDNIVELDTLANGSTTFDLFDKYTGSLGESVVSQLDMSAYVKNNLQVCIMRAGGKRAKRQVGGSNTGDFTEGDLDDIC